MIRANLFEFGTVELSGQNHGSLKLQGNKIEGVSVCTAGEAKGHGVHLEPLFLHDLVEAGNQRPEGIKARFGHPSFFSDGIGTFIGTFTKFRISADGNKALADLELSHVAKKSPHGNLYDYVLGMAENHPAHFGTSIAIDSPIFYQYDNEGKRLQVSTFQDYDLAKHLYMGLGEFTACDVVDQPAANSGLFSVNNNNVMTNLKQLIKRVFAAQDEPPTAPATPPKPEQGNPAIGDQITFTKEGISYLVPDGEFLISSGDLADSVLIIGSGEVKEIKTPLKVEEAAKLSQINLEKLPTIHQLQVVIQRQYAELERQPAGQATTAIHDGDEYSRPGDFKGSETFADEARTMTKFQPKKQS